jgi:nucleoid-associated protein YgaU
MAKAGVNGDFAITLNDPLKPGDYQLVLRAVGVDGKSANSAETATVSVPEQKNGPVLALVEEAGKPSRIITAPEVPQENAAAEIKVETKQAATAEVPVAAEVKAPEAPAVAAESVAIEAVETEEGKIFVAGSAKGVATVRIYANDQALGDAKPGQGDRFLGEFQKDLAPGDYIFRAEGLAADGVTVLSRASVPFQRQAAQAEPDAPAVTAQADPNAAPAQPDANAEATPAPAAPKPMAVIIRRGDTLWQISRRIYGRGVRYSTIYLANEGVTGDPNRIFPGQVFKVPEKTPEGEAADVIEIEKRAAPAENTGQ